MRWCLGSNGELDLTSPAVVAVINVTPDSFHAGSRAMEPAVVAERAVAAAAAGARVIEFGAESTRPGAARVAANEQINRLVPALRAVMSALGRGGGGRAGVGGTGRGLDGEVAISVDTTLFEVARAALDEGAAIINDVSGGAEDPGLLPLCAQRRCGVVLMHRLVAPGADSFSDRYGAAGQAPAPVYADVTAEVGASLACRVGEAIRAGVPRGAIVIDPGLGFGKTVEQNLRLIRETRRLAQTPGLEGLPVMSALSRKSFVGRAMGLAESTPEQRLAGTVALTIAHVEAGARLVRVHDPAEVMGALRAWTTMRD